jgi:aspartate aminotransferase
MLKEYETRRNILVDGLNSIKGISCLNPEGAFYVFANIKKTGMTSDEIANYLLDEAGVAVLPGTNFGEFGEGYIRLCYATSKENVINAIKQIKTTVEKISK